MLPDVRAAPKDELAFFTSKALNSLEDCGLLLIEEDMLGDSQYGLWITDACKVGLSLQVACSLDFFGSPVICWGQCKGNTQPLCAFRSSSGWVEVAS